MITGLTLFSGGGGVECGLSGLVRFVGGVEYDPAIAAHAQKALGTPITCADVCEVDFKPWAGVEYLHASPPCTNASQAKAKAGEASGDVGMAEAVARAIVAVGPRFFSLENVAGYAGFSSFKLICRTLEGLGYRVHWRVYDAADYGVPQRRRRLLLRAWKESKALPELQPTHGQGGAVVQVSAFSPPLLPWVGWYQAIEDLLPDCPDTDFAPWQVSRLEAKYGAGWVSSLLVHGIPASYAGGIDAREAGHPAPPLTASAEKHPMRAFLVPSQGYHGSIQEIPGAAPAPVFNTTTTAAASRAVLVEGQSKGKRPASERAGASPSPVQAGTGGGSVNRAVFSAGDGVRVVGLTPACLARFQSFPRWYPLPEKKGLATRIIGNAVPCDLARAVFGRGMLEAFV